MLSKRSGLQHKITVIHDVINGLNHFLSLNLSGQNFSPVTVKLQFPQPPPDVAYLN